MSRESKGKKEGEIKKVRQSRSVTFTPVEVNKNRRFLANLNPQELDRSNDIKQCI